MKHQEKFEWSGDVPGVGRVNVTRFAPRNGQGVVMYDELEVHIVGIRKPLRRREAEAFVALHRIPI
jgi:hypothetical protein